MKTLSTLCVASAAYLVCGLAANATPVVGNPLNGGTPTLNANLGNFDIALASMANVGQWTILKSQANAPDQVNGGTLGTGFGVGTTHDSVAIKEHQAWVNAHGSSVTPGPDGIKGVGPCNKGQGGPAVCDFTEGADWVSFADTGMKSVDATGPTNVAVLALDGGGAPIARYTFTFTVNSLANLGLWVYADDTAEVFISGGDIFGGQGAAGELADPTMHGANDGVADGRQRISPLKNLTQNSCAAGVIGCQPGEQAFVEMFFLSPNVSYTLEIDTFQVGSNPFGILYAGGLMLVPEPASLALLGLGLLGIGAARRRKA